MPRPDANPDPDAIPAPATPGESRDGGLFRIVAIALAITLVVVGYRSLVHPNLFPKRFGEVVPGQIFRSGKLTTAALNKVIREHEVKTVVDLGAWVENTPANLRANEREQQTAEALGVERFVFKLIGDATGDPNQYVEALRLMLDPTLQPMLVHCGAGTERTGCVVALYRMHTEGLSLDEAYAEAERAGHSGERNPRLRKVLETWSGPILEALESGGRIPWPPSGSGDHDEEPAG